MILSVDFSKSLIQHWEVFLKVIELYAYDQVIKSPLGRLTTLIIREATPEHRTRDRNSEISNRCRHGPRQCSHAVRHSDMG